MADRKATNKYYPPDWDPSKGSLNSYKKSHPLRCRARKIGQGILVVRFEMPFSIWCSGCNNHIGMGVRYNAEKSKVGSYYSTPIYQFVMKCHQCDNRFEIRTDPGKSDYIITNGARKQVRMTAEDDVDVANVLDLDSAEEAKRRLTDSMFRLEKRMEDRTKSASSHPNLLEMKEWKDKFQDSFSLNKLARSHFRTRRKAIEQRRKSDKVLLKKFSLDLDLVTPKTVDHAQAKKIVARRHVKSELLSDGKFIPT